MTMNDKMLHFLTCGVIAAKMAVVMRLTGATRLQTAVASVGTAMAAGVGKEYGDKNAPGNHWCWVDLTADFAGAVVGTAVVIGLYDLCKLLF